MLYRIYDLVADKLLNDAKTRMTEQMYSILRNLKNETEEERALWAYFRDKLNDVHTAYHEVKTFGISALKSDSFSHSLLGSATVDAKKFGSLPETFVKELDGINAKHLQNFKNRITLDVMGTKRRRDFVSALRSNTVTSFAENVYEIYELYKEVLQKRNFKLLTNERIETDVLTIQNTVTVNKTKLKSLVAADKVADAIILLKSFIDSGNTETYNEIINLQARYNAIMKNNRTIGEYEKEEAAKIRIALLELIDIF